ncbi:unnamed protein product, partial [Didymodactylos carnosus]
FYVYCPNGTWAIHKDRFIKDKLRVFEVFDEHNLIFQLGQVTGMLHKKVADYYRELGNDDEADQQLYNAVRINRTIQLELTNRMMVNPVKFIFLTYDLMMANGVTVLPLLF